MGHDIDPLLDGYTEALSMALLQYPGPGHDRHMDRQLPYGTGSSTSSSTAVLNVTYVLLLSTFTKIILVLVLQSRRT